MKVNPGQPPRQTQFPDACNAPGQAVLVLACFLVLAAYALMIDLKGISTDEGIRLGIINGGQPFVLNRPPSEIEWGRVLQAGNPFAYQPLYFLLQHTLMVVARSQNVVFLRLLNVAFLWACLQGLLSLSRTWRLLPRLFLIGVFSFNAYLFMHVLQLREYIAAVTVYVWSTWFVLRLDNRKLERPWADVGWFVAYGMLLVVGFYVQTWVVFPAIGQFLFLAVRRGGDKLRFYAHLALSYVVVIAATLPFLQSHQQRMNVGRWGTEGTDLWPQLSDGFHLVLSGHMAGHSSLASFLTWFYLALVAGAGLLLVSGKFRSQASAAGADLRRQGTLMVLSMLVPLAFQIGYFYRLDNLSVWPRYFVIHYFFLVWLLALAFRYVHELGEAGGLAAWSRRGLRTAVGATVLVGLASAAYQTASYYRDPRMDTGLTVASNWRTLAAGLSRVIRPDDVVIAHEFINRATLTFTRPISNRVIMLSELESTDLHTADRLVYLEPDAYRPARASLAARMATLGFGVLQEVRIPAADGSAPLSGWRFLVFQRP